MLQAVDLCVEFGDFVAVKNAKFSVARGESFGIVGESGSGKSTILRAILGLTPISSGTLTYDQQALGIERNKDMRRRMQMVFQDPYGSLNPTHVVDQIISEPMIIHGIRELSRRTIEVLSAVGLSGGYRFRFPHQLSGGQRQRVAIARALAVNPELLLLDEPTSALDVSIQAEILNLLKSLRTKLNLTMIMVSHDLAVIAHLCDRIAVMTRGEIVEILDVAQLRKLSANHPYTQQLLKASEAIGEVEDVLTTRKRIRRTEARQAD